MAPIAELTDAAREIERTRDPSLRDPAARRPTTRSPSWRARWRRCSHALDEARAETEATLAPPARVRRRRLARAAHAADLACSPTSSCSTRSSTASSARPPRSALRSSRRMRRLVADLLLLARADAGREAPHRAGRPRPRSSPRRRPSSSRSPATTRSRSPRPPGVDRRRRARRAAPAGAEPDGERAAPHRPGHRASRRRVERARRRGRARGRGRRARASRPSCATRSSSASSAAPATAAARAASASRSCARWPSPTAARSRSRTRSTGAARASWCGSRPASRRPCADQLAGAREAASSAAWPDPLEGTVHPPGRMSEMTNAGFPRTFPARKSETRHLAVVLPHRSAGGKGRGHGLAALELPQHPNFVRHERRRGRSLSFTRYRLLRDVLDRTDRLRGERARRARSRDPRARSRARASKSASSPCRKRDGPLAPAGDEDLDERAVELAAGDAAQLGDRLVRARPASR